MKYAEIERAEYADPHIKLSSPERRSYFHVSYYNGMSPEIKNWRQNET